MIDTRFLRGSDGTGNAVAARVNTQRLVGSSVLKVDSISKWPTGAFLATVGTIDVNGYLTSNVTEFRGHITGSDIIIDSYENGYTDIGNAVNQYAILKQTTGWSNLVQDAIAELQAEDVTRSLQSLPNYIVSGGIYAGLGYGTTLTASLTAITAYIAGTRQTVAALPTRTFTASKDTYVDILANLTTGVATLVYTEVANNAASPALAANSIRLAIIVTNGTSIANVGSINQGQETALLPIVGNFPYAINDSIGNRIAPRRPFRTRIGAFRKTDAVVFVGTTYVTYLQVVGESFGGDVTAELDLVVINGGSGATRTFTIQVLCDGVALNPATYTLTAVNASAEYPIITYRLNFSNTPAAGKHTWAMQMLASAGSAVGLNPNSKMVVKEDT